MGEKFLITLDDSHKNISRKYSALRNENEFLDVTLVSEDGVHIFAHKVVLAASSKFFKTSFQTSLKTSDHPKPIFFFSGINSYILSSIIDFIYFGEVEILKENVKSFFDIADKFKVDSIAKLNEDNISNENTDPEEPSLGIDDGAEFNDTNKTSTHEETLKIIQQLTVETDGVWLCKKCGRSCPTKTTLKSHLEKHFTGLSYDCSICAESFRSRVILSNHKKRKHPSIKQSPSKEAKKFKIDGEPEFSNADISNENNSIDDPTQFLIKEELVGDEEDIETSLNKTSMEFDETIEKENSIADESDLDTTLYSGTGELKNIIETNSHEEAIKIIQEMSVETEGIWLCKKCAKVCPTKQKLKSHLEIHFRTLSYECNICHGSFRSRTILATHKQRKH